MSRQAKPVFSEWFIEWDELPQNGSGREGETHLLAKTAIKLVR
jgi:hypothetical protein